MTRKAQMFIRTVFDMVFGCWHRHISSPRSNARPGKATHNSLNDMHVVCLGCGKKFRYDWEQMRVVGPYQPTQRELVAAREADESPLFI